MFLADQGAEVHQDRNRSRVTSPGASRQSISASGGNSRPCFVSSNRGKRSLASRPQAAGGGKDYAEIDHQCRRVGAELSARDRWNGSGSASRHCARIEPAADFMSRSAVSARAGPTPRRSRSTTRSFQGLSGFADLQGGAQDTPAAMIRTIVADKTTAIFAAQAINCGPFCP